MRIHVLVVVACVLAAAAALFASSASASSCQSLKTWGWKYEKVLVQTENDLRRDLHLAQQEAAVTLRDAATFKNKVKASWKARCSVTCKKVQHWNKIVSMRAVNAAYHQRRVSSHSWVAKLNAAEKQLALQRQQLVASYGPVAGMQMFAQTKAAFQASQGKLYKSGMYTLYKVHQGMLDDAKGTLAHAKANAKKWRLACAGCHKKGEAEFARISSDLRHHHRHASQRATNARERLVTVKELLKGVKAKRQHRVKKYSTYHYSKCTSTGLHSYRCWSTPKIKTEKCFRFFKCKNHMWHGAKKRLYGSCTV